MEKSTDLSRDEFISINHELSAIVDKYECYKKYLVCSNSENHYIENYNINFENSHLPSDIKLIGDSYKSNSNIKINII